MFIYILIYFISFAIAYNFMVDFKKVELYHDHYEEDRNWIVRILYSVPVVNTLVAIYAFTFKDYRALVKEGFADAWDIVKVLIQEHKDGKAPRRNERRARREMRREKRRSHLKENSKIFSRK